jgi:hypothetical protein
MLGCISADLMVKDNWILSAGTADQGCIKPVRNAGFSRQIFTIRVPLPHECGVPGELHAALATDSPHRWPGFKPGRAQGSSQPRGGASNAPRFAA